MTLTQFYDQWVRKELNMCWNTFCAQAQPSTKDSLKKQLKEIYRKEIKEKKQC